MVIENFNYIESKEQSPDSMKETQYRQRMAEFDKTIKEIQNISGISLALCTDSGIGLDDFDLENFKYPEGISVRAQRGRREFNRENLYPSDTSCEAYLDILRQFERVGELRLDERRLVLVLSNLELKRQRLHDESAEDIQKELNAKGIVVNHAAARKLFELLYLVWQYSQEQTFFYDEELDGIDLHKLEERIFTETGIEADISCTAYGFHANDPRRQYNIHLKGDSAKKEWHTIERIINETIAASKFK